jgi:3-ketosteroid 9alpha-monooxygenase subunit B
LEWVYEPDAELLVEPMSIAHDPRYVPLRVRAVVDETADAKSFVFDIPPAQAQAFTYRCGQFVTLRLPVQGQDAPHLPRSYSMSSAPGLDDGLRVTVKRVAGGLGSNWLCDHVRPGDTLQVLPPAGVFTPRALEGDFVLLAGGSGITPVLSILRSVLAQGAGRVALFYANRDERSVIFRDTLNELARAHPERVQVLHWLDSVQGVPTVPQLAVWLRPWSTSSVATSLFVCGPGAFMDATVQAAALAGLADEQVHVERFVSLPMEGAVALPVMAAAEPATPAAEASTAPHLDEAQLEIDLNGQTHRIDCGSEETLLEAALRHKLPAPYSCQAGLCAACMCRVVEGQVHMRHNDALDARDLKLGWVLGCQSVPRTAVVKVKYP